MSNTGENNTGHWNSGYRNSGYWNSGHWNSGYRNSGDLNSGNWNSGYRNSGIFNTDEPKMRCFGKDSEYTRNEYKEKFGWKYPDLHTCEWVYGKDMSDQEKADNAGWETTDGYLKTMEYKEAWKEYWQRASEEDKQWFLNLPNFNASIFEEITGINVEEKVDSAMQEAMDLLKENGYEIVRKTETKEAE